MYGKFFKSTFTGSMYGAGPTVFAVWGFVVANTVDSLVELNPAYLAPMLGTTPEDIKSAIEYLCQPDPNSRNHDEEGRRLIKCGSFQYTVVTYEVYRGIRSEDERRAYVRQKVREHRERKAHKEADVKAQKPKNQHDGPVNQDVIYSNQSNPIQKQKQKHDTEAEAPVTIPPKKGGTVTGSVPPSDDPKDPDSDKETEVWGGDVGGAQAAAEATTRDPLITVIDSKIQSNTVNYGNLHVIDGNSQNGLQERAEVRRVNVHVGVEIGLANWFFEELGYSADFNTRDMAAQTIRGMINKGAEPKDAADFLLQQARKSIEPINRFWFQDQKYLPKRGAAAKLKYREN